MKGGAPGRLAVSANSLGIPTFKDKVLQRAVAMVLEAVYEQEFLRGHYSYYG